MHPLRYVRGLRLLSLQKKICKSKYGMVHPNVFIYGGWLDDELQFRAHTKYENIHTVFYKYYANMFQPAKLFGAHDTKIICFRVSMSSTSEAWGRI